MFKKSAYCQYCGEINGPKALTVLRSVRVCGGCYEVKVTLNLRPEFLGSGHPPPLLSIPHLTNFIVRHLQLFIPEPHEYILSPHHPFCLDTLPPWFSGTGDNRLHIAPAHLWTAPNPLKTKPLSTMTRAMVSSLIRDKNVARV